MYIKPIRHMYTLNLPIYMIYVRRCEQAILFFQLSFCVCYACNNMTVLPDLNV